MISEATAKALGLEDRRRRRGQLPRPAPRRAGLRRARPRRRRRHAAARLRPHSGAETVARRRRLQRRRAAHQRRPLVRPRRQAGEDRRRYQFGITQDHWTMAPDGARLRRRPSRRPSPRSWTRSRSSTRSSRSAAESAAPQPSSTSPSTTASSPTSGRWRSTSTSARAAAPASSPARRRTTSPWSASENVRKGREMHWIRIDRYFTRARSTTRGDHPAAGVRALRDRALRVRLPGQRHRPQRRGPERDGLQPLHRHALLQQQLPVQGAPLQLPRLHQRLHGGARDGHEPGRHRPQPRHHGEVHVLRAAHRAQAHRRPASRAAPSRTASSRPPASRAARRARSSSAP